MTITHLVYIDFAICCAWH